MRKLSKKGFTLIELMIVLAIIAILAVVLVPKAGQMKDNARNAGVTTNVNSVRGFLESQPAGSTQGLLTTALTKAFVSNTDPGSLLKNPLDSVAVGMYKADFVSGPTLATNYGHVVMDVYTNATTISKLIVNGRYINGTTAPVVGIAMKGMVFVAICTDGYVVYGIDNSGTVINSSVIK